MKLPQMQSQLFSRDKHQGGLHEESWLVEQAPVSKQHRLVNKDRLVNKHRI